MNTRTPPWFETLVHGPPDASALIKTIDDLGKALHLIGKEAELALIADREYDISLVRIKQMVQEVLDE